MRIGLDGQALVGGIPTGFGVYAHLLLNALESLHREGNLDYVTFKPVPEDRPLGRVMDRLLWERLHLPRMIQKELATGGLDLFHSPCLGAPHPLGAPLIVTIHDLILVKRPPLGAFARYYFTRLIPAGWKRALRILTDSDTSKTEVVEYLGVSSDSVSVIPLYSRFSETEDGEAEGFPQTRARSAQAPPFTLLVVGSFEPRKNHELILRAFSYLKKDVADSCRLSLIGLSSSGKEKLFTLARELGITNKVELTGYVESLKLRNAYKNAFLLISASKEEGFDLPPLEAMSLGCPALLSNIPVHEEIYRAPVSAQVDQDPEGGGKNAGFFSPDSSEELANLLERAVEDESFYKSLSQRAKALSLVYSKTAFMEKLLRVYRDSLRGE